MTLPLLYFFFFYYYYYYFYFGKTIAGCQGKCGAWSAPETAPATRDGGAWKRRLQWHRNGACNQRRQWRLQPAPAMAPGSDEMAPLNGADNGALDWRLKNGAFNGACNRQWRLKTAPAMAPSTTPATRNGAAWKRRLQWHRNGAATSADNGACNGAFNGAWKQHDGIPRRLKWCRKMASKGAWNGAGKWPTKAPKMVPENGQQRHLKNGAWEWPAKAPKMVNNGWSQTSTPHRHQSALKHVFNFYYYFILF